MTTLPLHQLRPHPANSNAMPEPLLDKLTRHIEATGHYPPIIVRPLPADTNPDNPTDTTPRYQIIDGHHRRLALQRLGHDTARCEVWDVDDPQTLVLLATLNRLEGRDDPRARADLLRQLRESHSVADLADLLPEPAEQVRHLLDLQPTPPPIAPPPRLDDMPVAVQFFLTPADRKRLFHKLQTLGGPRDAALMRLVDQATNTPSTPRPTQSGEDRPIRSAADRSGEGTNTP